MMIKLKNSLSPKTVKKNFTLKIYFVSELNETKQEINKTF